MTVPPRPPLPTAAQEAARIAYARRCDILWAVGIFGPYIVFVLVALAAWVF